MARTMCTVCQSLRLLGWHGWCLQLDALCPRRYWSRRALQVLQLAPHQAHVRREAPLLMWVGHEPR